MMNLEQCEIKQLKQENEQLRAHVKRLAITLKYLKGFEDDLDHIELIEIQLEATPAQSLQQIKRDAANQAFDMMVEATNIAFMPHIEGVRAVFLSNLVKDGE